MSGVGAKRAIDTVFAGYGEPDDSILFCVDAISGVFGICFRCRKIGRFLSVSEYICTVYVSLPVGFRVPDEH